MLFGVSCVSSTWCLATGVSDDDEDHPQPFAEVFRRHHRTLTATPDAPVPGGLGSVSCVRATWCLAAAGRTGATNHASLDVWNGSTWSAPPFTAPRTNNVVSGTVCFAVQSCIVVGEDYAGGRHPVTNPLVETDMKRAAAS